MRRFLTHRDHAWARIAVLLLVAGVWGLLLAPQERSMGTTIRPVYLHVAATLAGMTMMYAAAGVGLLRVGGLLPGWESRLRRVWGAGVILFALGYLLSLLAAQVAWGGVFWAEPRVRSSVGVLAVGAMVWAAAPRLTRRPMGHLVWPGGLAVAMVMLATSRRIIHPEGPIQDVTPWSIRGTFYGLTALMLLVGWDVMRLMASAQEPAEAPAEGVPSAEAG